MAIHFTPIADEAPADAQTFNAALTALDAAIAALDAAIGKHNYAATAPPTANDDEADGYHAGSWWVDVNGGKVYVCVDPTEGAAVWAATGGSGGASSAVLGLTVLASPAATVTFSNIPGDYEVLELYWLARVSYTYTYHRIDIQFNDDFGNNYEYFTRRYYDAGDTYEAVAASLLFAGHLAGPTNLPATYASGGVLRIPGYAATDFYKAVHAHHQVYESAASTTRRGGASARWKSTNAIMKIKIGSYGYAFQIGSRFLLIATGG